ncbi:MAG: CoA pyrophosphatase [Blastocatellia bacterium]
MTAFQSLCQQITTQSLPLHPAPLELERVRQAAVTVLLREREGAAELLIIKRAERENDHWSGHLALPGGRADITDANLITTAARETWEEVGICLTEATDFLGRLPTMVPGNPRLPQIEIAPFIAVAPSDATLQLNGEVATAFWLPLSELQTKGLSDVYRFPYGATILKYPAYPSLHGPIWGITQRILTDFLQLLSN